MALTKNNKYLKITSIQFDFWSDNYHIAYAIFDNEQHRLDYKNAISKVEPERGLYNGFGSIETEITNEINKLTAKDSVYYASYQTLKNDMFSDWVDC